MYSFLIKEKDLNKRLDIFVSEQLNISRSQVKNYLSCILVNNNIKKLSYSLKLNDIVEINIKTDDNKEDDILAENIDLDILYEDEYLLVVNKPCNMSVHCSSSEKHGTLVNALLYHIKDFNFVGDKSRAGIIHRLDKDTSGIMIVGKNADIVSAIQEHFWYNDCRKEC